MSSCVTLAVLLAEQLNADKLLRQVAMDVFGTQWTVLVGADRRKLLPDKVTPLLLVLPEGSIEGDGPYTEHDLRVVMVIVCDKVGEPVPQVLDALPILDEQVRPHILHLVDNIPAKVTRAGWQSEINIEAFPLVVETLNITLNERLPIGGRLY